MAYEQLIKKPSILKQLICCKILKIASNNR